MINEIPDAKVLALRITFHSFLCSNGQQDYFLIKDSAWSVHFQLTGVIQSHPSFQAPYAGQNSLDSFSEKAYSVTSTLFLCRKRWKGASVFFNPEMAGGKGICSTLGIADFLNGETLRIGDPQPTVYVARFSFVSILPLDIARKKMPGMMSTR